VVITRIAITEVSRPLADLVPFREFTVADPQSNRKSRPGRNDR
jgi:hypothetical protein